MAQPNSYGSYGRTPAYGQPYGQAPSYGAAYGAPPVGSTQTPSYGATPGHPSAYHSAPNRAPPFYGSGTTYGPSSMSSYAAPPSYGSSAAYPSGASSSPGGLASPSPAYGTTGAHTSAHSSGGHGSQDLSQLANLSAPASFPVPSRFAEVQEKTLAQLERLESDEALHSFMKELRCVKGPERELESLRRAEEKSSDEISKMKENLEAVTNEALVLSKEANELRCTVEEKTRKKHEIMKKFSPEIQMVKLKEFLKEAESTAETIADKFIEGNMSCEDFLEEYLVWRQRQAVLTYRKEGQGRT